MISIHQIQKLLNFCKEKSNAPCAVCNLWAHNIEGIALAHLISWYGHGDSGQVRNTDDESVYINILYLTVRLYFVIVDPIYEIMSAWRKI